MKMICSGLPRRWVRLKSKIQPDIYGRRIAQMRSATGTRGGLGKLNSMGRLCD